MNTPERATADVGRILDEGRWGAYQKWLVFCTALTIIFDGIDNQLLGVSLPSIMRDWGVPRSAFAPVVALGYLGMMIGGAAAGVAGDRFGRRVALLSSMVLFGATTSAVSAIHSVEGLMALRLLAGIGLGGAMPNAAALAAEYVPRRQRPFAVTLTIVCVPLGGALAGLFALRVLPSLGWRALFTIGGIVPIAAAVILARVLPESPRYLARHPARWSELARVLRRMGHAVADGATFADTSGKPAVRTPFRTLFAADLRRDTMALWTAFFSCLLAVYLGFSWLPSILTAAGLGPDVASAGITVFNLGGVVGAIAGGMLITHVGSRATMLTMAAGAACGALVLSGMPIAPRTPAAPILVMLAITGGLINAVQTTMYALAAHVYSTRMRATGVGTAVSVGRAGAILSGYAGPWALAYRGSTSFFALMAGAVVVTLVALACVRRHVPRPGAACRGDCGEWLT
jgi:AAHS family 4-hydroxybenzoate transporter-like MFS transporter